MPAVVKKPSIKAASKAVAKKAAIAASKKGSKKVVAAAKPSPAKAAAKPSPSKGENKEDDTTSARAATKSGHLVDRSKKARFDSLRRSGNLPEEVNSAVTVLERAYQGRALQHKMADLIEASMVKGAKGIMLAQTYQAPIFKEIQQVSTSISAGQSQVGVGLARAKKMCGGAEGLQEAISEGDCIEYEGEGGQKRYRFLDDVAHKTKSTTSSQQTHRKRDFEEGYEDLLRSIEQVMAAEIAEIWDWSTPALSIKDARQRPLEEVLAELSSTAADLGKCTSLADKCLKAASTLKEPTKACQDAVATLEKENKKAKTLQAELSFMGLTGKSSKSNTSASTNDMCALQSEAVTAIENFRDHIKSVRSLLPAASKSGSSSDKKA